MPAAENQKGRLSVGNFETNHFDSAPPLTNTNTSLLSCFVVDDVIVYFLSLFTFRYHFCRLYYSKRTALVSQREPLI